MTDSIYQKVEATLDEVRAQLQSDGGDIELVSVENGTATVRLKGSCHGCPMAAITLKNVVEQVVKKNIPEITQVNSVE